MNKLAQKSLAFACIVCVTLWGNIHHVFADGIAHTFQQQSASNPGSNGSIVSIQIWGSPSAGLYYINKGDNSSVVGNYFRGYYYDSILGYFQVDALSHGNENVRVVWSTDRCSNWYGYKLWGYAYSEHFGFVDFDYNEDIYVYYCMADTSLHGYAYSDHVGFQNFEWISFPILVEIQEDPSDLPTQTGSFVNDAVEIHHESMGSDTSGNGGIPHNAQAENSNFHTETIQNDVFKFEVDKESLFYIIK